MLVQTFPVPATHRLNTELDSLRKGVTDPVVQECKKLRQQLARCAEFGGSQWSGWVRGLVWGYHR